MMQMIFSCFSVRLHLTPCVANHFFLVHHIWSTVLFNMLCNLYVSVFSTILQVPKCFCSLQCVIQCLALIRVLENYSLCKNGWSNENEWNDLHCLSLDRLKKFFFTKDLYEMFLVKTHWEYIFISSPKQSHMYNISMNLIY